MGKAALIALNNLIKTLDHIIEYLPNLVIGIIIYLLFARIAKFLRNFIKNLCLRAHLDVTLSHALGTLASVFTVVLGILTAATVLVPGFKLANVVTGLGITSVVIGFAFKDILQNFLAGLLLLWQKPFGIGDLIKTGEFEGVVEEITIRSTHLRTDTGELIVVPNGNIFTNPIIVRTDSKNKRSLITVSGLPNKSVEENRKMIQEIVKSVSGILKSPEPQVVLADIGGGNQIFRVYFWTTSNQDAIMHAIDLLNTRIRDSLYQQPVKV